MNDQDPMWVTGQQGERQMNTQKAPTPESEAANLRWANLRWANLSSADLSSADLSEAGLRWANLRSASRRPASVLGHELGHAFDHECLDDLDRGEWTRIMGLGDLRPGGWAHRDGNDLRPTPEPVGLFAEAWAFSRLGESYSGLKFDKRATGWLNDAVTRCG